MSMQESNKTKIVPIAENRRARHDYEITETYECGIVLVGTEVKSLRDHHVSFGDSYAFLKNEEIFILGLRIEPFIYATHGSHDVDRTRKLLLHKKEIKKIFREISTKGMTIVPLKIYFKGSRAKILIGLAKGKTKHDKRQDLKRKDADLELRRVLKRG